MKLKLSNFIVFVMLAVPVLRYSVAFQQTEPSLITPWGELDISYITGLAFGVSYEAAMYYGLREGMGSRKRNNVVTTWLPPVIAAGLQALVGIFIVVPVLVAYLQSRLLGDLLGVAGSWIWTLFVAMSSLLCFVTVSLGLAAEKEQTKPKQEETIIEQEQTKEKQEQFVCEQCGFVSKSQLGLNAHQRKHKKEQNGNDF